MDTSQNTTPPATHSDEEEFLLYVDFQTKLPSETFGDPNLNIKLIGIETEEPIIQINSKIFKGSYDYPMGTNVFFQENETPPVEDENVDNVPEKYYEYLTQTNKTLRMNQIFVEQRAKEDSENLDETNHTDDDGITVNSSYMDSLNKFLKPHELPPRQMELADQLFFKEHGKSDKDVKSELMDVELEEDT